MLEVLIDHVVHLDGLRSPSSRGGRGCTACDIPYVPRPSQGTTTDPAIIAPLLTTRRARRCDRCEELRCVAEGVVLFGVAVGRFAGRGA